MAEQISKAEAVEHLKQADGGVLITYNEEEVPVIGELEDEEDREVEITMDTYQFGAVPEEETQ